VRSGATRLHRTQKGCAFLGRLTQTLYSLVRNPDLLPPHMPPGEAPRGAVPSDKKKLAHINTYGSLPNFYVDFPFHCRDCGIEQIWTAELTKRPKVIFGRLLYVVGHVDRNLNPVERMEYNKAFKCVPACGLHRTRAVHAPLN